MKSYKQLLEDIQVGPAPKEISYKGYSTTNLHHAPDAAKAFQASIIRVQNGTLNDNGEVLAALKATDTYMKLNDMHLEQEQNLDSKELDQWLSAHKEAKSALSKIGEFEHHYDYWNSHNAELQYLKANQTMPQEAESVNVDEASKLQGTPVVSLSDFGSKDTTKNKYGQAVPKKLKPNDPRVKMYTEPKKEGVTEMDNRTASGDRREQRANSPEAIAQREKELQANLKKVSLKLRKKLRLPSPKEEGVAEGKNIGGDRYDKIADLKGRTVDQLNKLIQKLEGTLAKYPDHTQVSEYLSLAKMVRAQKIGKKGVAEGLADDFLSMAKNRNPNARIVTAVQKRKEAEELMKKREASGTKPAHAEPTGNPRPLGGYDPKSGRSYSESVESIDEISTELKQKYLAAATKKHLQQFLGREKVRDKQELDKRRAAIQKTSKELTGKTHYQESVELDEAHKIGSRVEIIKGSAKGIKGHIGEIRSGAYQGAPKTYTVYHGEQGAVQVPKEHIRAVKEEVELDEAVKKKLTLGSKVSHPVHGKGTVVSHSLGGGTLGTVVKFADGKKLRVDHKKLKTEEVESVAEGTKQQLPVVSYKEITPAPKQGRDFFKVVKSESPLWKVGETFSDDDMSMGSRQVRFVSVKRGVAEGNELEELRNVTQDQLGSRMGSSGPGFNKTPAGKARELKRKQEQLKGQMQFTKSQGGVAGPKGKLPEEVELDEALDFRKEAAKHMKDMHDKNATPTNKAYAQKMLQRALEASKMKDKAAAAKHYMGEEVELDEKTLTPAELKKREEVAKAMERKNPNMDKSRKMAIATAVAKRVAEQYDDAE